MRFPVFNLADVCIDIGVGLLLIAAWRNRKTGRTQTPASETVEAEAAVATEATVNSGMGEKI